MQSATAALALTFCVAGCTTLAPRGEKKATGTNPARVTPERPAKNKPATKREQPGTKKPGVPASRVDRRPDKRGRAVRTFFYGATLIREKVLIDGIPTVRVTIAGGAVLKHNGVTIAAPRIILEGGSRGRCVGGVRITDPKNGIRILARRADYNRDEQTLVLHGRPRMIIRPKSNSKKSGKKSGTGKPVVITARKLIRKMSDGKSILEGDVRILQQPWSLFADRGVYHDKGDRLVLGREPVIVGNDGFFTARKLVYFAKAKRIELQEQVLFRSRAGRAGISLTGQERERVVSLERFARNGGRTGTKPGKVPGKQEQKPGTVLTAEKLIHSFPDKSPPVTTMIGQVVMIQGAIRMSARKIIATGKDFDLVRATGDVRILDRKQNLRAFAGLLVYRRKQERLILKKKPRMEFLKKGTTTVNAVLTGTLIERDTKRDRTTARGSVRITRGDLVASGERADYDQAAEVIVLEGDPVLRRGNSEVRSEQVLIFPRTNRVLLRNRVSGSLTDG